MKPGVDLDNELVMAMDNWTRSHGFALASEEVL
jgi:hypothetical protein